MPSFAGARAVAAILAIGLAVSFTFLDAPAFLHFAIQADTLYPALLAEELRADAGALFRFAPSRIPSLVPDLVIGVALDLLTGDWRLAFWGHGVAAFALLSLLGGWIAGQAFGRPARDGALALGLLMAVVMLPGLALHLAASGSVPVEVHDSRLLVNPHVLLVLPVWHGGGFIIGLAVVALAWWNVRRLSPAGLVALGLLSCAAGFSNAIVIAHALLPAAIALAEAAWRRRIAVGPALGGIGAMACGAALGFWLGSQAGRQGLPMAPVAQWSGNAAAALAGLPAQPVMLGLLLAALPIGWAFLAERRAAALLPAGGRPVALRFFLVVASAAAAASVVITLLLYGGPMGWRYAMPLAWWPLILGAGMMAGWLAPHAGRAAALAGLAAIGLIGLPVLAGGHAAPALMRWRHPSLVCLDAADPDGALRAGLAAYWHARAIAATSGWRRQVESIDYGEGRPLLWIADPRSLVQQRGAAMGTPPAYRFLLMDRLDPAAIIRLHGPPSRILPCGAMPIWIFPEGWAPVDRLVEMEPALVPQALAIGRRVCLGPAGLAPGEAGRVLELPRGRWRIALHAATPFAGPAQLRVLAEPGGALQQAVSLIPGERLAELTFDQPRRQARARFLLAGQGVAASGLAIAPLPPAVSAAGLGPCQLGDASASGPAGPVEVQIGN